VGKARDLAYKALLPDPCGAAPVERPVMDDALGPEAKAPGQKR